MSAVDIGAGQIADWVRDARRRTFEMVEDLPDERLRVPLLETVNPRATAQPAGETANR